MILNGLKNFAKNLKYYIIPLGIIFLFFLFGLSIAIPKTFESINTMVNEVKEITASAELKLGPFFRTVIDRAFTLDWSEPGKAFAAMMNFEWLAQTFKECFISLVGEEHVTEIVNSVNLCIGKIAILMIFVAIMMVIGSIVAYFVTRSSIKQSTTNTPVGKRILFGFIELVGVILMMVIMLIPTLLWNPFLIIAVIILVPSIEMWHILISYWEYGYKKVKVSEIINSKVLFLSILTNLIIVTITFGLVVLLSFILSNVLMLFVLLSVIEVTLATNAVNIAAYIKKYVDDHTQENPQVEEQKEKAA